MNSRQRYQLIAEIYHQAVELGSDEQETFLDRSCAQDPRLKREVEELIAADSQASTGFMETPALDLVARKLAARGLQFQPRSFAHYRLLSRLGGGGMGEVFLAQDLKLGRQVAVKMLPEHFSRDPERLRRFELEAKAASALNDPRIITIHEIGWEEGRPFIVTEFVQGETLRKLMKRGAPLPAGVEIVQQIASALSTAHSNGIVHRDLKPENVMIRPDGLIKVLDFGLAKLAEPGGEEDSAQQDEHFKTEPGKVVGTIHYMSPEQALGKPVDHRTDVFSLGVILYEFACGKRPFESDSDAGVYDAILNRTPRPPSKHRREIPPGFDRVIEKALAKNPEHRYQDISQLRDDLDALHELRLWSRVKRFAFNAATAAVRKPLGAALAAVLLSAAAWIYLAQPEISSSNPNYSVSNAAFAPVTTQSGEKRYPILLPGDRGLLYAAESSGKWDIYLKAGGQRPLNLTESLDRDADQPALSPDGRRIAFSSPPTGALQIIDMASGETDLVGDTGFNPAWSPDGSEIAYAKGYFGEPGTRAVYPSSLWVMELASGRRRLITRSDAVQPHWSPDGRRIAYWGLHKGGRRDIWTIAADGGGEPVAVTDDAAINWNPVWSADGQRLYFLSDRSGSMNLWRVSIDAHTGETSGPPEPATLPTTAGAYFSFSQDGRRLVYVHEAKRTGLYEFEFDAQRFEIRSGPRRVMAGPVVITNPDLSPDGQWFVFDSIGAPREGLSLVRRDGSDFRKLTDDSFKDRAPRWHPEGDRILFFSDRSGRYELWTIRPDGSSLQRISETEGPAAQISSWSPSGNQIVLSRQSGPPALLDPERFGSMKTLLPDENFDFPSTFLVFSWSPDGRRLAGFGEGIYLYDLEKETFHRQAYEGFRPVWLPDSRRLLYFQADGLRLLDSASGSVRELLSAAPMEFQSLGVSKDGRIIYASMFSTESEVWTAVLRRD